MKIDDSRVQRHIEKFNRSIKPMLEQGISLGFDLILQRSQADYWRKSGGAPIPGKLTVRTGRLIRSLSPQGGSRFFGNETGGASSEQIRRIRWAGNRAAGIIGSSVPYAAIHEFGGTFTHPNLYGRGISATIRMPARPYLRPAAAREADRVKQIIADHFSRAWKQADANL